MKKYFLQTYGCQMNEHDSEIIAGMLEEMGYAPVDRPDEADLILFNTCCVRQNPEKKVYGRLGDLKRLKRDNPGLIIGVCGCMVQQKSELEKIREKIPHVDLVFGTHNLHRLPELVQRIEAGEGRVIEVWDREGEPAEGLPVRRAEGFKAWVTIMYGCDNFCSYCVVPYVRGRQRSRPFDDIVNEVTGLGREGYKEITLLGQNVNAYGKDLEAEGLPHCPPHGLPHECPHAPGFAELLGALDHVSGIERIRYTTSHPRDFSSEMIDTIAGAHKVCEHFHLPAQAGSDRILRKMNRGYTYERYVNLVTDIRRKIPEPSITTDLIVGFPGETDEDFEKTLDLVREVEFDSAFTFIYSPRSGTPAATMPGQVPDEVKRARIYRLIEVQNAISRQKNEALVGRNVELLIEGPAEKHPDMLCGRTRTNKLVYFTGFTVNGAVGKASGQAHAHASKELVAPGQLVYVKVTEAKTWNLEGEMLSPVGEVIPRG